MSQNDNLEDDREPAQNSRQEEDTLRSDHQSGVSESELEECLAEVLLRTHSCFLHESRESLAQFPTGEGSFTAAFCLCIVRQRGKQRRTEEKIRFHLPEWTSLQQTALRHAVISVEQGKKRERLSAVFGEFGCTGKGDSSKHIRVIGHPKNVVILMRLDGDFK